MGEELFLRKATGLVRGWSFLDIFAFNSWSNFFAGLAPYIITWAIWWPRGNPLLAVILGTIVCSFQCIVYSMLVCTMPRAGGDYIWISRILRSPLIGYTVILVAWVIVLQHWFPSVIWAFNLTFFSPLAVALGNMDLAMWLLTTEGIFWMTIANIITGVILVVAGMRWCGRMLKISFIIGGVIAVIVLIISLLPYTQANFINAFNTFQLENFDIANAHQQVIDTATIDYGLEIPGFWDWDLAATMPLLALFAWYNGWSMWGAPLYGEVKGASEFKRSFWSIQGCNLFSNAFVIICLLQWVFIGGWQFFQSANLLYWSGDALMPLFPFPGLYVYILTKNVPLSIFILGGGAFFLWILEALANFLPAIRILFAMAFDRVMPAQLAHLVTKRRIPIVSLAVVVISAVVFSWLYCFLPGYTVLTIDFAATIIIGCIFTSLAGVVLPFVMPKTYKRSPISKYQIGKIPVISIFGALTAAFFTYYCYSWATDITYGAAEPLSVAYLLCMYGGSAILYLFMKWYRKRQGIDTDLIFKEIPVE